jgi:hypothetical protein
MFSGLQSGHDNYYVWEINMLGIMHGGGGKVYSVAPSLLQILEGLVCDLSRNGDFF